MSACLKSQRIGQVGSAVRYYLGQLTLMDLMRQAVREHHWGKTDYVPHVINISKSGWGEGRKQAVVFGEHTLKMVF